MAHKRITFLIGPTATQHFYKAPDDELSQKEVYGYNVPTFGKGVVFDVDHIVRAEQFKMFSEALKSSKMKGYVPQFQQEAEAYFNKWGNEGQVEMTTCMEYLILCTASRTLLGREAREQMFAKVSKLIHDLDKGMVVVSVFLPYLPIEVHRKRDVARAELGSIFAKIIKNRRENNIRENDLLQHFVDSKYAKAYGGRYLNDEEICGMLIAVTFAGQHTSNVTISWTMYYLTEHKHLWSDCVAEQKRIIEKYGWEVNDEVLNQMEILHMCIKETLRLQPPLIMLLRYVNKAFTARTSKGQEYLIPKGDIVATSTVFSQRLPGVFAEPDKYDPYRYFPPKSEGDQMFAHVAFGGGRHGCLGTNFAYLQIKAVMSHVLRNFEFEFVDKFPEPNLDALIVGPKACDIKYKRITLDTST